MGSSKFAACAVAILLAGCSAPKPVGAVKQYPLTGKVVAVNRKDQTATIDAAAVPQFMDAMKMDYPITSASDLASLKPGESITATVNVSDDGSYTLTNIREAGK